MSKNFSRDDDKFTAEESKLVAKFQGQGWKFKFEEDYSHHNGHSYGFDVSIQSPRMGDAWRQIYDSKNEEITEKAILKAEEKWLANRVEEYLIEHVLPDWLEPKIEKYLRRHPKFTLKDLRDIKMENL
jgi:hypothetical protein